MTQQSSCLEFRGYGSIIFVHYGRRSATPKTHSCSQSYSMGKARPVSDHHSDKDNHTHAQQPHAQPARDYYPQETHITTSNTTHTSPYTHQNHSRKPIEHHHSVHHHHHHHSHYTDSYNDSSDSCRNSYSPEPEQEHRGDARLPTQPSPTYFNGQPTHLPHVPESHRYDAGDPKALSPADRHFRRDVAPEDSAVSAPQVNGYDYEDEEEHLLQRLSTIEEESLQEQARAHRNSSRGLPPLNTTRMMNGIRNIAPSEREGQITRALSSPPPSTLPNRSSSAPSPPLPQQKRPRSPSRERQFSPASPRIKCSPSDDLSLHTSRESSARPRLPQPHRSDTWPLEKYPTRLIPSPLQTAHAHAHGPPPVVAKHRRRRISSEEGARVLVNGVARFICHECNRYFTRANNLKMHRLTHAGTKPYLCKYEDAAGEPCPSAFTRKHDLQRHVDSVHLMATKFKCSHCGVECKRQDGFRRHQLSNPKCRTANNVAQVLRRRDETTAEAEMREEAEDMDELESNESDESSEEYAADAADAARIDRIERNAARLETEVGEIHPGLRPDDRWAWSHERPMSLHGP
ncbi:hypothetical protein BGZ68_007333 [Mortierella alpina]|nr:hypothetical protein BGZ68_007333 [Mortierella alpina]